MRQGTKGSDLVVTGWADWGLVSPTTTVSRDIYSFVDSPKVIFVNGFDERGLVLWFRRLKEVEGGLFVGCN